MREELDRPRCPPTGGARGFFSGVCALSTMGVRTPVRLGVRVPPAPKVRDRLGVRDLATMGVHAPVALGVRALPALGVCAQGPRPAGGLHSGYDGGQGSSSTGGPRPTCAGGPCPRRGSAFWLRWGSTLKLRCRALPAPGQAGTRCRQLLGTVAEVLSDCLLTSSLWAPQGVSAGPFLPLAPLRAAAPPDVQRVPIGGTTLLRSPGAAVPHAPTSPIFRVQRVATLWDGPPVPRIPEVAPLLGKRIARVQAPQAAMLAGPPKRVGAGETTTATAVLQACKAVCELDPVVSCKDGGATADAGCCFYPSSGSKCSRDGSLLSSSLFCQIMPWPVRST